MISRLSPHLGSAELKAALWPPTGAVERFEAEFATAFGCSSGLAFPYGRSALWAFFRALQLQGAEVLMPAYTCVVVAHATVLSGNIPRFVDIDLTDYNMKLDEVESAITPSTRVIVATHLFGYPLDVDRLAEIVADAEARHGHKIWIVQDCAHAFGARWRGELVCARADVALFGLNISKMITSIFGGMLTTNDEELHGKLKRFREESFVAPGQSRRLARRLYLSAVYPAFNPTFSGAVNWLAESTPLLNRFTKAYHLDDIIHFPPDYLERLSEPEAAVGLVQLGRYDEIVRRRRDNAHLYHDRLADIPGLDLAPLVEGATYSHYVGRSADRDRLVKALAARGIQLGTLIDYSIPEMPAYRKYADRAFPNAAQARDTIFNLPVHAGVTAARREVVIGAVRQEARAGSHPAAALA